MFINRRTLAMRPANVPVLWSAYWRAYPQGPITLAILWGLALGLHHNSGLAIAFAFLAAAATVIYLRYVKTRFERGNLCAGHVVRMDPFLVAVATDLANDTESTCPVIKIFSPPHPAMPVGTRVAVVSLYTGITPAGHWGDSLPALAISANPNPTLHEALLSRFTADEWQQLAAACEHLPKPFKCGLYHLTDWRAPDNQPCTA